MIDQVLQPLAALGFDPLIAVFVLLAATILGPFVTFGLKRLSFIDPGLGSSINMVVNLVAFLGLWTWFDGMNRDKLLIYLLGAAAAAGGGSAINNWWRKRWKGFGGDPDPLSTGQLRAIRKPSGDRS